ncbi:hypothetical protein L6452_00792 [Arctium lappa]|uniref:Uncharacterized protein n=1 Tax=Arctium lappa TaxID=4217 RepID=A0ACB9FEU8_ARCLA|nr:hypothetical protein L6452_00792 [Arctium lappa]
MMFSCEAASYADRSEKSDLNSKGANFISICIYLPPPFLSISIILQFHSSPTFFFKAASPLKQKPIKITPPKKTQTSSNISH